MAQPYVGEIRMFAGNFAPAGWMFCEGQLISISENETLYQLIGTTFGGDDQTTFALPDLRGRLPVHQGNGYNLAQPGGVEQVTLNTQQIPNHTHALTAASGNGGQASPQNNLLASSTSIRPYTRNATIVSLANTTVSPVGGSQPHSNMQPYLCLDFIISLFGIFPSPT